MKFKRNYVLLSWGLGIQGGFIIRVAKNVFLLVFILLLERVYIFFLFLGPLKASIAYEMERDIRD